ncbi:zinc transporter ZIP14-like protein 1 [Leptotrombidium deliense]|uniref:Zinc transporter ZIP14-like protein 1 n=1 Tax=Leptotrombidium deliense TaxID=299467 RepID=A0A443SRH1_9ACAR|nr:zinc transporter ZIP14-like protein 1 [Leptotrombidium deliense]
MKVYVSEHVVLLFVVVSIIRANSTTVNHAYLNTTKAMEKLAHLVLMRGHVLIGPSHSLQADEIFVEKLLDYLYVIQRRTHFPGGRRLFPATEERDLACDSRKGNTKQLCHLVSSHCVSAQDIYAIEPKAAFHQVISRICPLLLFRQMRPICKTQSIPENSNNLKLMEPPIKKVWGFGILFVTLSIVVSLGGLILLPFLKREARRTILTLFEGLAVGGLIGTAIIHLFPQAFDIGHEKFVTYFWKVFVIFLGIYLFYVVERILKLLSFMSGKSKRKRTSSFREEDIPVLQNSSAVQENDETNQLDKCLKSKEQVLVPHRSPKEQMRKYLAQINSTPSQTTVVNKTVLLENERQDIPRIKQLFVSDVAGRRKDQETNATMAVDSVAWMIVLGDACLNFIDGLSIGAAFDRNILAGISISVAVMLEEVTHRLGTFAVLIRAGMKMKQSFLWIFVSACALYPGLILGVFLGDEAEDASPYIFALAGGMFVYMALVDVMKEMNASIDNASRKGVKSALRILALQNLGIIIAIIFLSVLALYEEDMNFENVEWKELAENSLS